MIVRRIFIAMCTSIYRCVLSKHHNVQYNISHYELIKLSSLILTRFSSDIVILANSARQWVKCGMQKM